MLPLLFFQLLDAVILYAFVDLRDRVIDVLFRDFSHSMQNLVILLLDLVFQLVHLDFDHSHRLFKLPGKGLYSSGLYIRMSGLMSYSISMSSTRKWCLLSPWLPWYLGTSKLCPPIPRSHLACLSLSCRGYGNGHDERYDDQGMSSFLCQVDDRRLPLDILVPQLLKRTLCHDG